MKEKNFKQEDHSIPQRTIHVFLDPLLKRKKLPVAQKILD